MGRRNTRRLLCALYLTAGLPFGIFFEALPTYMRAAHCSLTDIGLLSLAQLAWSAKMLWSPLMDRLGRPDRWLLGVHLALCAAFVGLALRDGLPGATGLLPLMVLLATASAMQDTVADATFVSMLHGTSNAEQADAGSLRVACYKIAMMGGGGGAIVLGGLCGWRVAFALLAAAFAVAALTLPVHLRGAPRAGAELSRRAFVQAFVAWLGRPGAWGTFAFVLVYKLGLATLTPMAKPFWVDAGADAVSLGALGLTLGLGGTVAGAYLAGRTMARHSLLVALVCGTVGESLAGLAYAVAAHLPYHPALMAACQLCESVAQGLATAALTLLLSQLCDRQQAATQFAALTATFALTRALGGVLGGPAADAIGFTALFALLPLLPLPALALLPWVRRRLRAAAAPS